MEKSASFISFLSLIFFVPAFVCSASPPTSAPSLWKTLKGDAPLVIARGGFSGLFPDSSNDSYNLALSYSLPNTILWCDVQLTSDFAGVCLPDLMLDNVSDISYVFNNTKTYLVNGVNRTGWFSVDFTLNDLLNISLTQRFYYRAPYFDQVFHQVLTVRDVARLRPPGVWLNIQYAAFYSQHGLSMRNFVLSESRRVIVNYISSPEVNFLRSILTRFKSGPTKLVFRFLEKNDNEPSTNQTYGSLLKNLTFVKTFASGILVPKSYIWPVRDLYLQPYTSVVLDAHRMGLEIFASDFANDVPFAYNFSYDPVAEILKFIDNDNFSVDGVLSDFPITPSEAIDCYSHLGKYEPSSVNPLVITNEGASGDYPGCTDLAYNAAISDGADVLDCPVQMTKDGVPFCLGSINLIDRTTAAQFFSNTTVTIPELDGDGIYSFNLTWSQIKNLRPQIYNPYPQAFLYRNPEFKNMGKLVSLSEFLALANNATSVSGVLIRLENATYLAEQGLGVIDAVLDSLSKAGYNNQKVKKVMIGSSSSAVLIKLKQKNSSYEFVYEVDEVISDVLNSTILDIMKFANSVIISKRSVYSRDSYGFLSGVIHVAPKLKAVKLPIYVRLFRNEFFSQAWDFFSDAHVELNSFVSTGLDGIITDFPKTANLYRRNRCLGMKNKPPYMIPVEPGLLTVVRPQPPAESPSPVLKESDVMVPAIPPVAMTLPTTNNGSTAPSQTTPTPPAPNGQTNVVVACSLSNLAILLATLLPL